MIAFESQDTSIVGLIQLLFRFQRSISLLVLRYILYASCGRIGLVDQCGGIIDRRPSSPLTIPANSGTCAPIWLATCLVVSKTYR